MEILHQKNSPSKTPANFTDKLCTVGAPGTGKYELDEGIGKGKGFKGKGGTAILHNVIPGKGDIKVECASFKDAGSVSAPSGVFNVTSEFKKCKSLGAPCKTEGGKKETITTNKLAGSLGYLNKAHTAAGESLTSEAAPGSGYLAEFECEGLAKVRVHGAVIGALTPFGVDLQGIDVDLLGRPVPWRSGPGLHAAGQRAGVRRRRRTGWRPADRTERSGNR